MENTQDSDISTDSETSGFDLSAGKIWIYPENYPVRDYQFNIVQTALYYNTLVCLPTGLGKTFIAAVIMYNFWRWYPRGKVIFLAPTRPLVAQQIDACHDVMGIPSTESIELTGSVNHKARQIAWFKKRVIFATPQVFHNDLENNIIPSELVKCVVIDEAHKALGKHSYCECIRILSEQNQYFRILALSATPGNKIANVHQVVQNLHISHMELRDETSPDIVPYVNQRKIDIILVPLGEELERYKGRYINIMDRHVKYLIQCNVIHGQTANISKGKIFIILREFQKKADRSGNYGQIIKTLNILLTMYHAYELMIRHGLRAFYNFFQNHSDKFWMNSECQLQELIAEVQTYLGPFPNVQQCSNGDIPDIPDNLVFGHNKFSKLKELLLQHFQMACRTGSNTRAIVFVEYRDIVSEVYILLLQARPLIRPQMFVGQAEQKQKKQIKAIEDFKNNCVNVLISTSIGEEGLDVGEVDLIICFDVSQKSPTRLVQRMGRTGRKRDGHIIVLVTDGREHETLRSTMARRESLNSKILNTSNILPSLYQNNPRMIPNKCTPQCHKMHINVQPKTPVKKGKQSKKVDNKKTNETLTKKTKNARQSFSNELKNINQPLMSRFLVNTKNDEQFNSNDDIELVKPTIINIPDLYNKNNLIKPSNVKLITCDNEAVDFLTLCAMKKSEHEITPKTSKMDMTYVPSPKPITSLFDFTVPSIDILDNLGNLLNNVKNTILVPEEDSLTDYASNDDFWCNNEFNIMSPVNRNVDECINVSESRFEDLLDESTDSDKTVFSVNEKDADNKDNKISIEKPVVDVRSTEKLGNDNVLNTNCELWMDAESSIFEDIFNDSFDSIDDDIDVDNIENNELTKLNSKNDPSEKVMNNKLLEKGSNIITHKTQAKGEHAKNETMFSITQAVQKIAQINSRSDRDTIQSTAQSSKDISINDGLYLQNKTINEYVSEDDMFASELDEDFEINPTVNESSNKENLNTEILLDANSKIAKKSGHVNDNLITVDDFECNTDFEVSSLAVTNSKYFNNSANVTLKNAKTTAPSCSNDITWDDTDSDEWISFEQRFTSQKKKKDDSKTTVKKLSVRKHSISQSISQCISLNRSNDRMNDQNDVESDFLIGTNDMAKLNDLESNYFSKEKILRTQECKKSVVNDSDYKNISFGKVETPNMTSKSLSSFKAPNKYLKTQSCNESMNAKPSQSQNTKLSRDLSYGSDESIKRKNKHKITCKYIDNEAEVTFNNTQDESSGTDEDLPGFVSYTQHVPDEVDMRAVYLQAVKSPVKRPGAFVFKEPQVPKEEIDVYSQPCSQIEESYLQDSFCVDGDHDEAEESKLDHEYSILEKAERILEDRKRKRMKSNNSENSVWKKRKKRKKIEVLNTSTSSEDETEKLRKEICDESMILKEVSHKWHVVVPRKTDKIELVLAKQVYFRPRESCI